MKQNEKPEEYLQVKDPKPPIIRSGRMENRKIED